jgi:glycine betaine/proline transport system substrate-binding protein
MVLRKALLLLVSALAAAVLAAGCGGAGGSANKELRLGYIEWDENVAVSNLTKVLLEEDLGYESVELQLADVGPIFSGVASGDLDAFQDVWMPNHENYMADVEDDARLLEPWYEGETKYGIVVPDYMEDVQSIADLNNVEGTNRIIGIEPGAAFHPQITDEVIPAYNLEGWELVESSTPAMLSEVERAYSAQEPIVFLGWSPHWMNAEYDFHYLEDPKDAQGEFDDPSQITTLVNNNLQEDDPVAYAFLENISMSEEEVNTLEAEINEAGDPIEGAKAWLEENRDVVQPWVDAAEQAQGS